MSKRKIYKPEEIDDILDSYAKNVNVPQVATDADNHRRDLAINAEVQALLKKKMEYASDEALFLAEHP